MYSVQQNYQNFNSFNLNISSVCEQISNVSKTFSHDQLINYIATLDNDYFLSLVWKKDYNCNGFVSRTIITSIGEITFKRRYYIAKDLSINSNFYYVDQQLQIPARKHLTNDALCLIFTVAAERNSSYAARNSIHGVKISKQTVSNYQKKATTIHDGVTTASEHFDNDLKFNDIIYVELDEAHCNLQKESTIDDSSDEIKVNSKDKKVVKKKNKINKLGIIHNGLKNAELHLKRHEIDSKHYVGGINLSSTQIADTICNYIDFTYATSNVKYLFVSGDGARWIKQTYKLIADYFRTKQLEVIFVLDKFHYHKYMTKLSIGDKTFKARLNELIKDKINPISEKEFYDLCLQHYELAKFTGENKIISRNKFEEALAYITSNFDYIRNQDHEYYNCPASMEGQISHVLADRFTSRPMGFCEPVLQNITQMRLYLCNKNIITPKTITEWFNNYEEIEYPKYQRTVKSYKPNYEIKCSIPLDKISDTNTRNYYQYLLNFNIKKY